MRNLFYLHKLFRSLSLPLSHGTGELTLFYFNSSHCLHIVPIWSGGNEFRLKRGNEHHQIIRDAVVLWRKRKHNMNENNID